MEDQDLPQVSPSRGPAKLRPVHIRMLEYIMANPGCTYEQISLELGGYSIGWISQIYNSDAFQAELATRQVETFGELKLTIKDRVTGLAHASLKRLEERLPVETDLDKVSNVADLALKSLGFGTRQSTQGAASHTTTNIVVGQVDPKTLAAARELMHARRAPELSEPSLIEAPAGHQE